MARGFSLKAKDVRSLKRFISGRLANEVCDHTLRHTLAWATKNCVHSGLLTELIGDHGGFCDCEVLCNVPEKAISLAPPKQHPLNIANPWLLPPGYASPTEEDPSFTKVLSGYHDPSVQCFAPTGDILVPAPRGLRPLRRVRPPDPNYFFVGIDSGLPSVLAEVTNCEMVSASVFAERVRQSGNAGFEMFGPLEAVYILTKVGRFSAGTPVVPAFLDIKDIATRYTQLEISRVILT